MSLWRLVIREIAYRKVDFGVSAAAVILAVAVFVAVMTLLRAHEARASDLASLRKDETMALMRTVQDDYRKITLKSGYNVLVLSKEQDLAQFYAQGYATEFIPESHVNQLAESPLITVRHLMPTLSGAIEWPTRRDVHAILMGVRSEVPQSHLDSKAPLSQPVEHGQVRVGFVLARQLGVREGDSLDVMGRAFTVSEIPPERGNADDITLWLHLEDAQAVLNRPGQINAIMALSCHCAEATLEGIRGEIAKLLPDTQVIQLAAQTTVRALARDRAAALSDETVAAEEEYHRTQQRQQEALAAWLLPMTFLCAGAWVGLQTLVNVRARRSEIGIWRALGFRSRQVVFIFLTKAILLGVGGAIIGYVLGFTTGLAWSHLEGVRLGEYGARALFDGRLLLGALFLAPFLSVLASWIPTQMAARQDPVLALRID
ncbi:MAG: FtsX-like permease family protein [Candidatus Hydrogenedentes bacterium]|nr:FtsX-like permease family protein [Candidatus Hydrogenedentota bacterium]